MDQHVTSLIGIMLQDFEPLPSRYSLEESIRRQPSLEDALRVFPSISFDELHPDITSLWVMHEPVDDEVLGFTFDHNYGCIKLSAHKAEPREGWYCKTVGFIFGSL